MLNTTAVGLEGLTSADVTITSTNPHMFRPCMALIRRWLDNRASGVGIGAGSGECATESVAVSDTCLSSGSATATKPPQVRVIVNGLMTAEEASELVQAPGYVFVQTEQWENLTQPYMVPVYRAARAVWCMDTIDYMYMVRTLGIPEAQVAIVPVLLGV